MSARSQAAGRARLLVLTSAVLFGTTGTAQALGPGAATPATVGAARIAVGGALLVALGARLGGLGRLVREHATAVAVAAAGVAAYQVCFFAGVARTGVAVGTIVALGSAPAFAGAVALAARGERPERRWPAATALAVAGGALLVVPGRDAGVEPSGVALALGAGLSYAVYTVAAKAMLERGHAPEVVMAAAFGAGALLLAPVLALGEVAWLAEPGGLALVLYLGALPTALAYVLFARGLARLPAATVATLTLAEPLTAAVLGVAVLGERPTAAAVLGALLVLGGLVVLAAPGPTGGRAVPPPG